MNSIPQPTIEMFEAFLTNGLDRAVFDFDGTLARTDITKLYFFLRCASFRSPFVAKLWKYGQFALYGPLYLLIDRIDRPTFQRIFYRRYERFTGDQLAAAGRAFFSKRGEDLVNPQICALLCWLKQQGVEVEIHTTNLDVFVKPFADQFGVPVRALKIVDTAAGCRVDLQNLRAFKEDALRELGGSKVAVIADSISDLPAFRAVAFPVLVADAMPRWAAPLSLPTITTEAQLLRGGRP